MSIANWVKATKAMKAKKMSIEYIFDRALHSVWHSMLIKSFAMLISSFEKQVFFKTISTADR